jgi:hypothetical protein
MEVQHLQSKVFAQGGCMQIQTRPYCKRTNDYLDDSAARPTCMRVISLNAQLLHIPLDYTNARA